MNPDYWTCDFTLHNFIQLLIVFGLLYVILSFFDYTYEKKKTKEEFWTFFGSVFAFLVFPLFYGVAACRPI